MKRLFIWGAGIIACGLAVAALALSFILPSRAEALLMNGLREAGFQNVSAAATDFKHGAVILKDIKLDSDGFSTIAEIRAEYGWPTIFTRRLGNLKFSGMKLIGELNADNSITIAGWRGPAGILAKDLVRSNAITLEKVNVDLLSEKLGGINLKIDGQAIHKSAGGLRIQGHIEGVQRQLSVSAKLAGDISPEGAWQLQMEIEQGKVEIGQLKAGRISGTAQLYGNGIQPVKTIMQLSAGAITIYDLPWQDASVAVETAAQGLNVFIEGKSIGEEGIEFGANFNFAKDTVSELEGTFHAEQLPALFAYLQEHKIIPADMKPPAMLASIPGLSLSFAQNPGLEERTYFFGLNDPNQAVDIKGNLKLTPEGAAEGVLAASPLRLEKLIAPEATPPEIGFTGGAISVSGDFKISADKETREAGGKITALIDDGSYRIGPLRFKDIDGNIVFTDLKNWNSENSALSFKLPLRPSIEQSGKTNLKIQNGTQFTLNNSEYKIFKGKIALDRLDLAKALSQEAALQVSAIDMGLAVQAMDVAGLHLAGPISGTLPLAYENGALRVRNGSFHAEKGHIRFKPEILPAFLKGDDIYIETMRLALENYHFTTLDVKADGRLDEEVKLTIAAQGSNPDMFDGRPVALNFIIAIKPSELVKKILE